MANDEGSERETTTIIKLVPANMAEPEGVENLRALLEVISKETSFLQNYFALRKRCEHLQQCNETTINRIQHMKKQVKKYKREKRYLMSCLDEREDNYRDVPVPVMQEDDQLCGNLRSSLHLDGIGSDSEPEVRGRYEHKTALSSIQPLLQAHGMGNLDAAKLRKIEERDSNAPKKPVNAFLMFCTMQRTSIQEQYFNEHNEKIAHHELTKTLAQQWNALGLEEKQIYYEMCEREKERFEHEMHSYKTKSDPEGMTNGITNLDLNSSSLNEADAMSFK